MRAILFSEYKSPVFAIPGELQILGKCLIVAIGMHKVAFFIDGAYLDHILINEFNNQRVVLADHIGNTGLWILASSFSIYSTGVR